MLTRTEYDMGKIQWAVIVPMRNNEEGIGIVWWSLVEAKLFKRFAMNTIICLKMFMILELICHLKNINQKWKQKLLKSWSRKLQQTMSSTPSMTLWTVMGDPITSLAWPAFHERLLPWSWRQHRCFRHPWKSLVMAWLQHSLMQISITSAQPIGTVIYEGMHKPFQASACPIRALDYDESQMRDDDVIRHQQRSEVEYDCWIMILVFGLTVRVLMQGSWEPFFRSFQLRINCYSWTKYPSCRWRSSFLSGDIIWSIRLMLVKVRRFQQIYFLDHLIQGSHAPAGPISWGDRPGSQHRAQIRLVIPFNIFLLSLILMSWILYSHSLLLSSSCLIQVGISEGTDQYRLRLSVA